MARVLCIDTDRETAKTLKEAGHEVFAGTLGYTDGRPSLATPPHEVDLIVCDLREPACFDSDRWGPGLNNNFECTLGSKPPVVWKRIDNRYVPRYRLIMETQMRPAPPRSFGPADVHRAILKAGVAMVLMLNPEWQQYVAHDSVNVCGLVWRFAPTKADRIVLSEPLLRASPRLKVRFGSPALYRTKSSRGPFRASRPNRLQT